VRLEDRQPQDESNRRAVLYLRSTGARTKA